MLPRHLLFEISKNYYSISTNPIIMQIAALYSDKSKEFFSIFFFRFLGRVGASLALFEYLI